MIHLPNILDALSLVSSPTGLARYHVTLKVPAYGGGWVHVSTTTIDGTVDSGDCMVHLPSIAFAASHRDMLLY